MLEGLRTCKPPAKFQDVCLKTFCAVRATLQLEDFNVAGLTRRQFAVLLVILGGGLAVQLSLFWWLGSKSLLVLSVSGFNCAAYTLLCALSSLTVFIQSAAPFSGGCWLLV